MNIVNRFFKKHPNKAIIAAGILLAGLSVSPSVCFRMQQIYEKDRLGRDSPCPSALYIQMKEIKGKNHALIIDNEMGLKYLLRYNQEYRLYLIPLEEAEDRK